MATGEAEAVYLLLNYTLNLSYIFIPKNPIFLYNFDQKWLPASLQLTMFISYEGNNCMLLSTYR